MTVRGPKFARTHPDNQNDFDDALGPAIKSLTIVAVSARWAPATSDRLTPYGLRLRGKASLVSDTDCRPQFAVNQKPSYHHKQHHDNGSAFPPRGGLFRRSDVASSQPRDPCAKGAPNFFGEFWDASHELREGDRYIAPGWP
jgi:hypothetical protein